MRPACSSSRPLVSRLRAATGAPAIPLFLLLALLGITGCQTMPPAPAYSVDQPDGTPPLHAALRDRDRERLAGADELLSRPETALGRRASLLSQRGSARFTLGQYAGAVADMQEAIAIVPGNAPLRLQLARAMWALGRETEALEQVMAARTLNPDDGNSHLVEGFIHYGAGRWAEAADSFSTAAVHEPENGTAALYQAAARQRAPDTPAHWVEGPLLRALASELWPVPIIETMLGRRSAEDLIHTARHPDPLVHQTWQTEVAFFLGEKAAQAGDSETAIRHYRETLSQGVPTQTEFILARARLRALGQDLDEAGIQVADASATPSDGDAQPQLEDEWNEQSKIDVEINRLVRSGVVDQAILRLREANLARPSEDRLRMLASLQAQTGRAEAALATWRSSLRGDASDWQPLAAIGWLELQLALTQGTTSGNAFGNVLSAAFDPWSHAARKEGDRHLAAAREAFERAHALKPDDASLAQSAAQVHQVAKDYGRALEIWRELRATAPDDLDVQVGEASALLGLGRVDEARPLINAVLEREVNHAGAHAAAAELARRGGDRAEARRQGEWASFASMLPRGSQLSFTPENVDHVHKSATQQLSLGPFVFLAVNRERRGLIESWRQDTSPNGTGLLAAAWWNAPPNDVENVALAQELHARGMEDVLRDAVMEGGNPSAVGAAAHALAQAGDASICNRLIDLLQQDLDRTHVADFAGALATLGEIRAAMPLAAVLDPDFRSSPRFSLAQQELALGYLAARARAALALASFDSAYARAALEAGTRNPEIALYCHAALFAQTKEPAHWEAIASALRYADFIEARRTFALLKRTGEPDAVAVAEAWERRRAEREKRNRAANGANIEFVQAG